jgi:hypothetical protein
MVEWKRLAVPATVLELLAEQPGDDPVDGLTEVGTDLDRAPVDARLDLSLEERLSRMLPPAAVPDTGQRGADIGMPRLHAEVAQQPQRRQGCGPRLTLRVSDHDRGPPVPAREARAPGPLPLGLHVEQPATPSFFGHPCPFRGHLVGRSPDQVPQHLPPDRGVGVQQPPDHVAHDVASCLAARPTG